MLDGKRRESPARFGRLMVLIEWQLLQNKWHYTKTPRGSSSSDAPAWGWHCQSMNLPVSLRTGGDTGTLAFIKDPIDVHLRVLHVGYVSWWRGVSFGTWVHRLQKSGLGEEPLWLPRLPHRVVHGVRFNLEGSSNKNSSSVIEQTPQLSESVDPNFAPPAPTTLVLPFFWLPPSPLFRIFQCCFQCWEVRLPVLTEPFQILLDGRIQCVVLFLSSDASEYEAYLCFVLDEGTSAHLLMFCALLFSTLVLLEDLDRRFSWR